MVCFSFTLTSFSHAIVHAFQLPTPPAGLFGVHGRPLMRIAPAFAVDAFPYLYWRPTSRKVAFGLTVFIHALHNLIGAIPVMVYAARNV
jgi:hypothetical protein